MIDIEYLEHKKAEIVADHCYMGGFVIAWMPLPEPYKEGQDE